MQRSILSRRNLVSAAALFLLIAATLSVSIFVSRASAATYVSLNGSVLNLPAGAKYVSAQASSKKLTVTVVLQPNNSTQMNNLLTNLYNPSSSQYQHWLTQGQFNREFGPTASQAARVKNFLTQAGFKLVSSPSPFLMRAAGTTAQIESAFHTQINSYRSAQGQAFFQNATSVQIPANISSVIAGVAGLSNTTPEQNHAVTTAQAAKAAGKAVPLYGAAPGGSGLTPAQTSSLYDAAPVYKLGNKGKGQGATLAVFELSGYTSSDITTYEHQFFGKSEKVKITNVNVDGGPVTPACPTGDECGPFDSGSCANGCDSADFSGDIEVDADVETQIAIAPNISHILVYNAPNDEDGITVVDEYFKIASDNLADSISSSWGGCESDEGIAVAKAESVAFSQMAAQGQSMFASAGDTGAFDCLRGSGTTNLSVDDPASQPFVTGVGGTSFGTFDPGANTKTAYPNGSETVWNVLDACSASDLGACSEFGAGGGGISSFWAAPSFQSGPGVNNSFTEKGPKFCSQATKSTQTCREVPDVSANADEFTPYGEFCTGDPTTNSECATFSSTQPAPGWFGIGGTSLSSPLWSGVIALWDSVHGKRFGSASFGLYHLFREKNSYNTFFHDITGKNQTENNNGFYPTTANYDMATGIGTPRISGIAEAKL
jgi:subtilase family serine protease